MSTQPLLLSDRQAAALLGIGRTTFWRYVGAGRLPRPVKLGNATRWRRAELEAVVDALAADAPEARGAA